MPNSFFAEAVRCELVFSASQQLAFVSDMHLHSDAPRTYSRWLQDMQAVVSDADVAAIFVLGDWFEAWVGDDCLQSSSQDFAFERSCADEIAQLSRQKPIYFLHGNRDFLLGAGFQQCTGAELLSDPCVLIWGEQRIALSHGDAMCTDDADYQHFRALVRSAAWQSDFLKRSLTERTHLAREMRKASQAHQEQILSKQTQHSLDVNPSAVERFTHALGVHGLIHGHTHRPCLHQNQRSPWRWVLSDWDWDQSQRGQVCRMALDDFPQV